MRDKRRGGGEWNSDELIISAGKTENSERQCDRDDERDEGKRVKRTLEL